MTRDVWTLSDHGTLQDALRVMAGRGVGVTPVVDVHGRVQGMLTDRDVALAVYRSGLEPSEVPVSSVMSRSVICCGPDDRLTRIETLMATHRVRRLPVVDHEGRLLGIVTIADLARAAWNHPARNLFRAVVHTLTRVTTSRGSNHVRVS